MDSKNKNESYSDIYKDILSFMKDIAAKEESNEVQKAISYIMHQEMSITNLEKSISGEWIEKAGYGVGTIRIWRGKKYKKISINPVKWVRVYDKVDRGAKNAMTRLIHKAEAYKNDPEGMMKFMLENKQRFYNEDQKRYIDLVDRLNEFLDGADYNKTKEKPYTGSGRNLRLKPKTIEKKETESTNEIKIKDVLAVGSRITEYSSKQLENELKQAKDEIEHYREMGNDRFVKIKEGTIGDIENSVKLRNAIDNFDSLSADDKNKLITQLKDLLKGTKELPKGIGNIAAKRSAKEGLNLIIKDLESKNTKKETEKNNWITDFRGNRITVENAKNKVKTNLDEIDSLRDGFNEKAKDEQIKAAARITFLEEENKHLTDRMTTEDRKEMESEAEKHQNRSEAMKGNQNAYKGGAKPDVKGKSVSELQNELVQVSKDKSKVLDEIKELNAKVSETRQKYYEQQVRDNDSPKTKELKDKLDGLLKDVEAKENYHAEVMNYGEKLMQGIKDKESEELKNSKTVALSPENVKAFNTYAEKFSDERRQIMRYPSEVDIDGKKMLAYTDGKFLVVTNDIPAGVNTKQSMKMEGNYPNVARVIPDGFKSGTAQKIDININEVMEKLPKIDFSKKNFDDDSKKQYMKIGKHWYDAKQIKAVYDMLKGGNAVVMENVNQKGNYGSIGIKTDKGFSVIMSLNDDNGNFYEKQAVYDSSKGSMSRDETNAYELKKRTGLNNEDYDLVTSYGYKPDKKGIMYGENKKIGFKNDGKYKNEFYYEGIPTGLKLSNGMFETKEKLDDCVKAMEQSVQKRIDDYKEGGKNPIKRSDKYDPTFPNMSNEQLTDIMKWWTNPENIKKVVYQGGSGRKGIPGIGTYNTPRQVGAAEKAVFDMLPDIENEIKRRGIRIKKSIDGEFDFVTSLEDYVLKSIEILKHY